MINGKQQTIRFHVDDVMSSHVDPKVNDEFLDWLNRKYGKYGAVKATRGKVHDYLGMTFEFEGTKVKVNMIDYVKEMLREFPVKFNKNSIVTSPAGVDLFSPDNSKKLDEKERETFHRMTAKALFLCKRARPDIQPIVAVLCTRVKKPGVKDWNKLVRMMKHLHNTVDDVLVLSAENGIYGVDWMIDAAFAVHPDFRSHTGATMSFKEGTGAVIGISAKQKLNTNSSTTAELVAVDQVMPMVQWVPLFMESQGYDLGSNSTIYQDNKSAILLEKNGKSSSGKRTRALNIRYFFITDQVKRGTVEIKYCPTDDMVGDYMTKGLQGVKYNKFRNKIMGKEKF